MTFIKISYDSRYDDPPDIYVYQDTQQVLLYEVYEGCCFELSEYVDDMKEVKTGYYKVDYDFYMESECYEMPHIRYPVINTFELKRIKLGWFVMVWIKTKQLLTNTGVYI